MPLSVTCDSCSAEYQLRTTAAGKKIRCKSCGDVIRVPSQAAESLDDLADLDESEAELDEDSQQFRRPPKSGKNRSRKSKRSRGGASGPVAEYLGRQFSEAPVRTVVIAVYGLLIVVGFISPIIWMSLAFSTLILSFGLFVLSLVTLILLQLLHNPWLILGAITRIYYSRPLTWEQLRIPISMFMGGVYVALFCIPPSLLLAALQAHRSGLARNRPATNAPASPVADFQSKAIKTPVAVTAAAEARDLFQVANVPLPEFLIQQPPQTTPASKITYFEVQTKPVNGVAHPGSGMRLRLYMPRRDALPKTLGCVLVAPAGSNLISGKPLDDLNHEAETVPYVQAGMAVVHFSLDGPISDLSLTNDSTMSTAYKEFSLAAAGLVNARNAMAFVLQQVREVDPRRIYIAGHSSAGSLALLFAEHEPSVRGCIAFAASCEPRRELAELGNDPQMSAYLPGIQTFVSRSAPITHVSSLACPVFLFHGAGDQVVPISQSVNFSNAAKGLGKKVTFSQVSDGDHYRAMAEKGVPLAIQWLKTEFGEPESMVTVPELPPELQPIPTVSRQPNSQPPSATTPVRPKTPSPMGRPALGPKF
ncbi:MAG: Alpha/beta hydrolase family protein [Planctomycetaceae bacterium]|nr:Alpha/beta hydrolase family protein [Planctomycetaceae bacterium]